MTNRQRNHVEGLLLVERSRLKDVLANLKVAAQTAPGDSELQFANREFSGAAFGLTEDDDEAIEARAFGSLEEVEDALKRLTENPKQYGFCEICGRSIATGRLELLPATRRCGHHALRAST